MKTKTALVLTAAGVLLTGSAALAVNTQTLNGSSTGNTVPANVVLLPQNSTTAESSATAPPPGAAVPPTTEPSPSATPGPSLDDPDSGIEDSPDGDDTSSGPALAPAPSVSSEPFDDHSGRGESESGHKHSGNDD